MCNKNVDKIEFCANILNEMYVAVEKHNNLTDLLYQNDIDIINMEIGLFDTSIKMLSYIMGFDVKPDIEWWLFEDSEKIIYINEESWDVSTEDNFFKCLEFAHDNFDREKYEPTNE